MAAFMNSTEFGDFARLARSRLIALIKVACRKTRIPIVKMERRALRDRGCEGPRGSSGWAIDAIVLKVLLLGRGGRRGFWQGLGRPSCGPSRKEEPSNVENTQAVGSAVRRILEETYAGTIAHSGWRFGFTRTGTGLDPPARVGGVLDGFSTGTCRRTFIPSRTASRWTRSCGRALVACAIAAVGLRASFRDLRER